MLEGGRKDQERSVTTYTEHDAAQVISDASAKHYADDRTHHTSGAAGTDQAHVAAPDAMPGR